MKATRGSAWTASRATGPSRSPAGAPVGSWVPRAASCESTSERKPRPGSHALSATSVVSPAEWDVAVERDRRVPMRDGVPLATDVYRPARGDDTRPTAGSPPCSSALPTTRAGRSWRRPGASSPGAATWSSSQDVRGRHRSDGEWYFLSRTRGRRTASTRWTGSRAQPWCDGQVGTMGLSYSTATQQALALLQPRALRTQILARRRLGLSPPHAASLRGLRAGRAPAARGATGARGQGAGPRARAARPRWTQALGRAARPARPRSPCGRATPRAGCPRARRAGSSTCSTPGRPRRLLEAARRSAWPSTSTAIPTSRSCSRRPGTATTPGPRSSKYERLPGTQPLAHASRRRSLDARLRRLRPHVVRRGGLRPGSAARPERRCGSRWFDHFLKGLPDGPPRRAARPALRDGRRERASATPRAGSQHGGTWRAEASGRSPAHGRHRLYLRGDGALCATSRPRREVPPRRYRFDPADPVPTVGGQVQTSAVDGFLQGGAFDQRGRTDALGLPRHADPLAARADVLVFQTEPLAEDLEVTGEVVGRAVGLLLRGRHRLHRQADRRLPGRLRHEPRRHASCARATATRASGPSSWRRTSEYR